MCQMKYSLKIKSREIFHKIQKNNDSCAKASQMSNNNNDNVTKCAANIETMAKCTKPHVNKIT